MIDYKIKPIEAIFQFYSNLPQKQSNIINSLKKDTNSSNKIFQEYLNEEIEKIQLNGDVK